VQLLLLHCIVVRSYVLHDDNLTQAELISEETYDETATNTNNDFWWFVKPSGIYEFITSVFEWTYDVLASVVPVSKSVNSLPADSSETWRQSAINSALSSCSADIACRHDLTADYRQKSNRSCWHNVTLDEFIKWIYFYWQSHLHMLQICSFSSAISVIYNFTFRLYYISFCSLSTTLYMSNLVSILLPFCW